MENFKGTKGEWNINQNDYYIEVGNTSDDDKKVFNCCIHINREKEFLKFESDSLCEENRANALLISKAPELLEALIKIVDAQYKNGGTLASLNSEIANAKKLIKEATNV